MVNTTRVAAHLAINLTTISGSKEKTLTLTIASLTPLLFYFWHILDWLATPMERTSRFVFEAYDLFTAVLEVVEALRMVVSAYWQIACIIGKAVAFSMGVNL